MTFLNRINSSHFLSLALVFSLILLIINAWEAPISGDEYVHFQQAEKNIRYFQTFGKDTSALHTPISRLKHYGQSFDNITTLVIKVFSIDDIYRFRHLANSFIAWLVILFTSITTIHLSKSKLAGIISILLMLITARFMGHAMNNLKDIPFALSFIFSIYCILKFLDELPGFSWKYIVGITLGLAFGISIRIGGLLIYAYYILFSFLWIYFLFQKGDLIWDIKWIMRLTVISVFIFILAYFLGIIFWPWAWENPITNPLESLALIKNYPTTVRQVFEGELFWSDRFPWYYLFKYLLITLPVMALLGFIAIFIFIPNDANTIVKSLFLLIAFGFPLFYAGVTGANVYGGWRQMLFVYPPLVVLSSMGIWQTFVRLKAYGTWKIVYVILIVILSGYPVYYSIANYPYQYTYFNLLQGGFKVAYGQYELDYYFTGFKKAYQYIDNQSNINPGIVATNFLIPVYYYDKPYQSTQIDYYNRSASDWDYAIICNTFLNPWQLQNDIWPPENTIHQIEIEGRPILAIIERGDKADLEGVKLLRKGKLNLAIKKLEKALSLDQKNESILINLARAYNKNGDIERALTVLEKLYKVYPDNEWGLDLEGEMLMKRNDYASAIKLFERNISNNHKFFHSYVNLAKAQLSMGNKEEAVNTLRKCLQINPFYEPAYKVYGRILVDSGEVELGRKMLEFEIKGNSKYGTE